MGSSHMSALELFAGGLPTTSKSCGNDSFKQMTLALLTLGRHCGGRLLCLNARTSSCNYKHATGYGT
eukprot:6111338-Amphidinium_carterae.1